jgi:hypothetical protein
MKILFACIPIPHNRFMADLKAGLEKYAEVVWDYKEFWNCTTSYDIVHIHWPEYLSYELESYLGNTNPIPSELWARIEKCFDHWAKHSAIVYTRHVQGPHTRDDYDFRRLYRLSASFSSAVAHFGEFSIGQFKQFYPELDTINHKLIPHHNYESIPNVVSRNEARKKLRIKTDENVMLVFGSIKEPEKKLILEAFSYIPGNKTLLAPGWQLNRPKIQWIRLRELVFKWQVYLNNFNKKIRINKGIIPENEAQYYCNAADFLFIPRTNELNSGNITFGFTFGLVVVGKDSSDIGEILLDNGNPVFSINDSKSLEKSIREALILAKSKLGSKNREVALLKWNVDLISKDYIDFFKDAIQVKRLN